MSLRASPTARVVLILVAAGSAALLGHRTRPADAAATPPPSLLVESLVVRAEPGYEVSEAYNGRVESRRQSSLGFPRGDRVIEVRVREGNRVEAGALLARLDTALLRATRREIEAQVTEIEARLELAELTLARTAKLAGRDSISQQRHDEARIEEAALRARLAAARAGIDAIDVDLDRSELVAPYGGSITRRVVDEGTIVAPGQEILQIIETGAMEVRIGVPSAIAGRLRLGERHRVRIEDREIEAVLVSVSDEIASDTRTVSVVLHLDAPNADIRHGAMARLTLRTLHPAPGFWLPLTALSESHRGLWSAYALVSDDTESTAYRVERRVLQLIHTESDRAFLRGTLHDGERVVATGLHRLVPDQRVRVDGSTTAGR